MHTMRCRARKLKRFVTEMRESNLPGFQVASQIVYSAFQIQGFQHCKMDTSHQQPQSLRVSNLRKSYSMATHSLLTACSKEDFLRIFSSFKHGDQEILYRLYMQIIASMHENVQAEFESICQETQVVDTLGTIEQLIENQKLDVLHQDKGGKECRATVSDVKQEAVKRKISEIHYLKNMLVKVNMLDVCYIHADNCKCLKTVGPLAQKVQEQNQMDRKRIEFLSEKKDDLSRADNALTMLKTYNVALKEISQNMNVL